MDAARAAVTDTEIRLVLQTSLLGEVGCALRGVAYGIHDREVLLRFYFDGEISTEDRESAACVATEVAAALPEDVRVTEALARVDAPGRLPADGRYVFRRREPG